MRSIAVSTGSALRAAATSASVRPCHFRFCWAATRRISTFSASAARLQRPEADSSARIAARATGHPAGRKGGGAALVVPIGMMLVRPQEPAVYG